MENKTYIVYGLKEVGTNELKYIGQTNNLKFRFNSHKSKAKRNVKSNTIYNSPKSKWIRSVNFNIEPVVIVSNILTKKEADEFEEAYIKYCLGLGIVLVNSDYNKYIISSNAKIVYQYSLTGELIKEWNSTIQTVNDGFSQYHVSECCTGKRKTHKGFKWSYEKR